MTAHARMTARIARPGRRPGNAIAIAVKYLVLVMASAVVIVPLLAALLASLRTNSEMGQNPNPLSPPHDWFNYHNFVIAFDQGHMLLGLWNTAILMVLSLTGSILIGTMTAYAIDRFRFRFKKVVLALFLIAALVPGITTQVATFRIINSMNLVDTRWSGVLLYTGTDIISIYIFLQFIRSIPTTVDDAARIDGCSSWAIYWRIILPLMRPAIATVIIIKGVFIYNDFYIPYLYMNDNNLRTVSIALFNFKGPFGAEWNVIMAGSILVIIPALVIFLFLQRFIYNGLMRGSVK